jgi:hypothetical protein
LSAADDIGANGMDLIRTTARIYQMHGYKTQILAASIARRCT